MIRVSVIIPTYNRADLLPTAISSVLAQTYTDWELIVVDDASTDNTMEVIKEWEAKDSRIRSISLNINSGGPAHPKNVGVESARGEFIAFLDHDDEWLPEKLKKQVAVFASSPRIGLVTCEAYVVDDTGEIRGREIIPEIPKEGIIPAVLRKSFMFSNSSLVIPRVVIDHLGPRDESPNIGNAEDREYELRIASAGYEFGVVREPLFRYFVHSSNATLASPLSNRLHYAMADFKYLSLYEKYNSQWMVYKSLAWGYLKLGDKDRAKEYRRRALFSRPYDPRLIAAYVLSSWGRGGEFFLTGAVRAWHEMKYAAVKSKRWNRKMDPHVK